LARLLPIAATLLLTGCGWIGLGWGAATFPTTATGESANVVAGERFAYATRGADGIEIIELTSPKWRRVVAPSPGTTADDLAIADGLLFVLDARPPGGLSVYSLENPELPRLVQAPVMVDVGPFSGVSAANGLVVVSGGTSLLSLRRYEADGRLGATFTTADLGRGQPDVLLSRDGRHAFVSTHDSGPHFSLTVLALGIDPLSVERIARLPLETYGFTPGGARPSNFPIEMAIDGDRLLVASAAGLQVFDVADRAKPVALATLKPAALPVNVDARDGLAAVVGSDPDPELTLVDLADPSGPRLLRSIRLPEGSLATGVVIAGRQAVVAAHAAGTLVFNLDDLTQ
jgi:hypothetical protein